MEVLISAAAGDLVSRFISFLAQSYGTHTCEEEDRTRLERILLRMHSVVEEAEGRHITNRGMLRQLKALIEGMYLGYYMLDRLRVQSLGEESIEDDEPDNNLLSSPELEGEEKAEVAYETGGSNSFGMQVSAGGHGGYSDADDAVDFRGNPVDKSKTGGWLGAGLILGTELAERVCVMGISMNLFDGRNPREERAMVFFFNRFYFCISLGSLFAVTVLVYVQDNVGRGWGYGVSAAAMALGVVVLVAGTSKYRYRRPAGSPLTVIGRVLWTAWKKRKLPTPANADELNGFHTAKVAHTDRLRCLDKAAVMDQVDLAATPKKQEQASTSTMTEVEEVKMVVKLMPIWSTCILFWTIYSQMTTFSVEQATRMDRRLNAGFEIPAGSLSVFLFLSILLFTSLNERFLVPLAARLTGRAQGLTSLQRVGTGLVFATVAMVVAALVEKMRRDAANGESQVAISAFWLVPQFFIVGAGEAFAYVGQLEFFIREAPERMKSMSTGLFLVTLSMGFFLSSFLVFLVHTVTRGAWIRNNLDRGRLDLFYWMLAVLGVVNFVVFVVIARQHEYKPNTSVVVAPTEGDNDTTKKETDGVLVVSENTVGMDV
ncbi:unnamed protein product [Triticum turgidum subsp. durum]|uniref:Uncharacterized protein n=1 Tax=Triticum turgidum subsp. durum TaxID=4567 RepID=A0A9R0TYN8_TRITD|nr:unnamed protein product [Triticum turgidum subsp. durum]